MRLRGYPRLKVCSARSVEPLAPMTGNPIGARFVLVDCSKYATDDAAIDRLSDWVAEELPTRFLRPDDTIVLLLWGGRIEPITEVERADYRAQKGTAIHGSDGRRLGTAYPLGAKASDEVRVTFDRTSARQAVVDHMKTQGGVPTSEALLSGLLAGFENVLGQMEEQLQKRLTTEGAVRHP
jgi:hypothetical protein